MTEEYETPDPPTDKLFVASLALPPGGSRTLQDGDYTVRIDRAAPPRQVGWYLASSADGPIPLRWTGTRWEMALSSWTVLPDPVILDRLVPYREVLDLLEGLSAAETRLERKYTT